MIRKLAMGAACFGTALSAPVLAKKPAAQDEAAVRAMIERVYTPYRKSPEYDPADLDSTPAVFELERTASLSSLEQRWENLMEQTGELYAMNGFSWYCQCQDYDTISAKLVRQIYKQVGRDRIDAEVLFSPGSYDGRTTGKPLTFRLRRENGVWKLDDLKFSDKSTLRAGLAQDIKDATQDLEARKMNSRLRATPAARCDNREM
jgi:hypothetical protein